MSTLISESNRKRLSDHLRDAVLNGISGRDGADLPEKPYRLVFSGVLQAPRQTRSGDLDASAIGINYKIGAVRSVQFKINVGFALYYPVFPPYHEIARTKLENGSSDSRAFTLTPWHRRQRIQLTNLDLRFDGGRFDVKPINTAIASAIEDVRSKIPLDEQLWTLPRGTASSDLRVDDVDSTEAYTAKIRALSSADAEDLPRWSIELIANQQNSIKDEVIIELLLANSSILPEDVYKRVADWNVYDAGFTVAMPNVELKPFEFLLAPQDYRFKPFIIARGINCSAEKVAESPVTLATQTLPVYEQPYYRTRQELDKPFEVFADQTYLKHLEEVKTEMNAYAQRWRAFVSSDHCPLSAVERGACLRDLERFEREIAHFELGMECLRKDLKLRRAFVLMNEAFRLLGERSGGRIRSWRLFQLGFIVSQLPAIAARAFNETGDEVYSSRLLDAHKSVGVLWFPTGGGKTEAYLGLIAASLLYDRLRGKIRGVNTWMRFPLRMLSLQQLERMARVIAVLNEMRCKHGDIAGGDEFAIGFFAGKGSSPNRVSPHLADALGNDASLRAKQRQILKCPHCGARVDVAWFPDNWSVAHVCSNDTCFSNTEISRGENRGRLPIYIVDDEIYRVLPSVLVGTVDKLAWSITSRDMANVTVGVEFMCPQHGYFQYDKCIEKTCKTPTRSYRRCLPSIDPGPTFLVQDEFHLLRDELGVFAGHYEGLLQVLLGENGKLAPKILAATATIEAYENQAFQIYLKSAVRYPEAGWEAGESFYATSRPLVHRRSYVGVLGHTRSLDDVVLRIEMLYLREMRLLRSDGDRCANILGIDGSENSEAIAATALYDFILTYVNRKAVAGSLKDKQRIVDEFLARSSFPPVECRILTGDNSSEEIGETLDRIERECRDTGGSRLEMVAATSLISHGVDLERINCMIVTGMPSHYAEYVQSSSRCARSHPGTIFVCFRRTDVRESSQYQAFYPLHEHLDRLIEPVAVNRFASFAPHKTVPGMLVGYCMNAASPKLYRDKVIKKPLDDVKTLQTALGYAGGGNGATGGALHREAIEDAIYRAIGVDMVHPPALDAEVERLHGVVESKIDDNIAKIGRSMDQYLTETLDCLISFRDIDEGVQFSSLDSMELLMRLEG